jgi:hypothetical protein
VIEPAGLREDVRGEIAAMGEVYAGARGG